MSVFRLLLVVLALAAPVVTQAQEQPNGQITVEADGATDAAIATRIREILAELGGYEDVTVQVSEGIVTLRGTTTSLAEVEALDALVARVDGVVAIKNEVTETADIARRLNPAVERFQDRLNQLWVTLPLVLIAAATAGAIVWLGLVIARRRQPFDRLAPNAFIADLLRAVVRIAFVVIALVVALDILNATALLGTILGAAGIVGLAIGFAVKDTVENFIASVLLSIRQPFGPNDVVEINGDTGKVIRLTSRATILLSFDGNQIRIPNATVFKSRIVNFSKNPETRFMFTICVSVDEDLAAAKDLAAKTIADLPFTLQAPTPAVWLGDITDGGIEIVMTGWIAQAETSLLAARGEALRQVKRAFAEAGIEIPDKTYRVRVEGADLAGIPESRVSERPHSVETAKVAEVAADTEQALDAIIDAERSQADAEDLLRPDAAKE